MSVNILKDEFERAHGGPAVRTEHETYLLSDGAVYRNNALVGLEFFEPSADPTQRVRACHKYHSARLALASNHFAMLRAALLGQGSGYKWDAAEFGADPGDGKAALLKLQKIAMGHREAVASLDAAIEQLPETQEAKRRADRAAQLAAIERDREHARRADIASITI